MAKAKVSAGTKPAQEKSTSKPASSTTPQSRERGRGAIVEIIENVRLYAPETPLPPSAVSKLYAAAKNYSELARAFEDPSEVHSEYFTTRLASLQSCVAASKSGKFNLSPREMKRCAGVFAVKLFEEIRQYAEFGIEEAQDALDGKV
jgi:hypothetical protein